MTAILKSCDGKPVACTGEYIEGMNAREIVETMKRNSFQTNLTVEVYMQKTLDKSVCTAIFSRRMTRPWNS